MFAIALLFAISTDTVLYQSNHRLYSVAKTDGDALLLLDYDTGRLWRLRPGGDGYVAGPSIGIDSPIALRVLANDGELVIHHGEAGAASTSVVAKRLDAFRTELTARGTLYLPAAAGRHPLLIAVPGSSITLAAPYFARRGIAVLALEKRKDWQTATFDAVASDVIAAASAMRTRSDISSIGIYASNQGGWVAPIAAAESGPFDFVVCSACSGMTMPQQERLRTEAELKADGFDDREIRDALGYRMALFRYFHDGSGLPILERADGAAKARGAKWYPRFGGVPGRDAALVQWWRINDAFDPATWWRRVEVPVLLIFGERDTSVPASDHMKILAAAVPRARIVIVRDMDHEGFIAVTGGRDEVPRLNRIPPRAMEPTIDWILAR